MFPTGSKDPFALRRAAIGLMSLVRGNDLIIHFGQAIRLGWLASETDDRGLSIQVGHFLADRLEALLRDDGVRHDFIRASVDWNTNIDGRIDRIERRARSLQAFIGTEDGVNLLAGYKRAANILKKEGYAPHTGSPAQAGVSGGGTQTPEMPAFAGKHDAPISLSYTPESAEKALVDALADADPRAATAVEAEQFAGAMAALATLRGPIDAFFDSVTVNDPAPEKRACRLALLDSFRAAVHKVADFSKIEG